MASRKSRKRISSKSYKKHNHLKKTFLNPWFVLIGTIIFFNILLLGWNYKQTHRPVIIGQWPAPVYQPTPTAAPALPFPQEFKTKHYNPNDKYFPDTNYTYKDLIPTDDDLLVSTSCSPLYSSYVGYDSPVYVGDVKPIRRYVNKLINDYVNKISNNQPNKIVDIMLCTDGKKTVAFSSSVCGAGCYESSISIFEQNDLVETINNFPNDIKVPYFGCRKFLEITKSGDLYIDCGGGDGPGGGSTLYKLNLNDYSLSAIKSCTGTSLGNGKSQVECK